MSAPVPVAVLIDSLLTGGAERIAVEGACRIPAARFAPHVIVTRGSGPLEALLREAGVPLTILDRRRRISRTAFSTARGIVRDCGLIHAHKLNSAFWGALLSRATGVPLVVTEHNWSETPSRAQRLVMRHWVAPAARRIACVSDSVAHSVLAQGVAPGKVCVVPNGVDPGAAAPRAVSRRELGLGEDDVVVGVVGALRPEKAHDLLLRAVARLPGVRLCVVGEGPCEATLRDLAGALDLGERVVWAGSRPDAPRLAAAFDVGVLCSRWEGLPLSALETMAAGVPLVATAVGGLPGLLAGGEGLLVPPGDAGALAAAISAVMDAPDAAAERAERGRRLVRERYSLDRMAAGLATVYDAALAGPRENLH